MLYELEHSTNVYLNLVGSAEHVNRLVHRIRWQDGPASYEHWLETPNSLYAIANSFHLCVILITQLCSTTTLPLYSYLDRPGGTLCRISIGFLHCSVLYFVWVYGFSDIYIFLFVSHRYRCMMGVRYLLYTFNGFIIVPNESAIRHRLERESC
ncbi:hypothetical protein M9H77_17668 [Catharanthus roseus]|uniref:Uncharacterized protein n=1 Tax=Catharanthus roseus TaxID=4058 RepID=A0ACC0B598_CATRO|nr:hypothetical protein M9H77_17668 [Catharanthus roseus]